MLPFLIHIEEQKAKIQEFSTIQESRLKNDIEAMYQSEELDQHTQFLHKIGEKLETKLIQTNEFCEKTIEQMNHLSKTLNNASEIEENVRKHHHEIQQKLTSFKHFFQALKVMLKSTEEQWEQLVLETKEKEKIRENNQKMMEELEDKKEEIESKRMKLEQNNVATERRIAQNIKKHKDWVIKEMETLQELNIKFEEDWKKYEELTRTRESLKNKEMDLENSINAVTNEKEHYSDELSRALKENNEAKERKEEVSKSLELMTVKRQYLEEENVRYDQEMQKNMDIKEDLTKQIDLHKLNIEDNREVLNAIIISNESKLEEIEKLQALLQEQQLQQEALKSDYSTKILELKSRIDCKNKESADLDLDLQREEQTAKELLMRLKENKEKINTTEQELKLMKENFSENIKKAEELQVLSEEENKRYMEAKSETEQVYINSKELQKSVDETDKSHEEYRLQIMRAKSEAEQDLKNSQRELQNTTVHCDWITEQTMSCVDECKRNYAKHVEEKEAAVKTCKEEFHLLEKQDEEATADKEKIETEYTKKVKELENEAKQLEEELKKMKEENQEHTSSTLVDFSPSLSEHVGLPNQETSRSILKFPVLETDGVDRLKHVHFPELSSESDSDRDTRPWNAAASKQYFKSKTTALSPNYSTDSHGHQKPLSQPLENRKTGATKKFFSKSRSQPFIAKK
ncbi:flagellar attachment zone protein 1-like [Periplaneta americana]|uniref:flagellar attachment zone protein 1-like n=1 Tax=Periplaneta americana TaxID=6978 RepID=UPI0037E86795